MGSRRLPLAGERASAQPTTSSRRLVPQAIVVVPAYTTAPVWPVLAHGKLPRLVIHESDRVSDRMVESPMRHRRLEGEREELLVALPDEPHIVIGETAAKWVQGGVNIVVAGVVGVSAWSSIARSIDAELVLRSSRPSVFAALERRFCGSS